MYTYIFTFIYGFISGLLCNYALKFYIKYIKYKDIKKTLIHEAYSYVSENIFNLICDDLIKNVNTFDINGLENLNDFKNLIDSSIGITHEFNKSFKLRLNDGKIQLKILNPTYINNEHFVRLCKFFTDNNVELHIIMYEDTQLDNKVEYKTNEKVE